MERHQTISKRTDTRFPYTMLFRSQILGGRVGEQGVDFGSELAKLLGADAGAAHQAQLVLDQRVADFDDLHRWTVWWRRRRDSPKSLAKRRRPRTRAWAACLRVLSARSLRLSGRSS